MNIVHELKDCGHIEFWSRHRLAEKARISWILHGANNLMSILYAPKLFLTNQNFANILETSIKVLLYQKIAKKNVALLSRGICKLDRHKDQICYSSRKDMNCKKMIKYVRKSPCERVEIKKTWTTRNLWFPMSSLVCQTSLCIFINDISNQYFWYIMQ